LYMQSLTKDVLYLLVHVEDMVFLYALIYNFQLESVCHFFKPVWVETECVYRISMVAKTGHYGMYDKHSLGFD